VGRAIFLDLGKARAYYTFAMHMSTREDVTHTHTQAFEVIHVMSVRAHILP